jgi:hypothetical protein
MTGVEDMSRTEDMNRIEGMSRTEDMKNDVRKEDEQGESGRCVVI